MVLEVQSAKSIHDNAQILYNFNIVFGYCPTDFTAAFTTNYELEFYLRERGKVLVEFEPWDKRSCTRTYFEAILDEEVLPLTLTDEQVAAGLDHPLFSFDHTEPSNWPQHDPSTGALHVHESNDLENVGLYVITVTEFYWERRDLFFTETIFVEIKDPCTRSAIYPPRKNFKFEVDE